MFYLISVIDFYEYMLILDVMSATCDKDFGTRNWEKTENVVKCSKNNSSEYFLDKQGIR